jgi:2'-5' RNA ligase
LGRDATGAPAGDRPAIAGLDAERLEQLTAAPRHYALHATLKPPFILAEGTDETELAAAIQAAARGLAPFTIPALELRLLDGFLALTPTAPSAALDHLAGQCVALFDRFRRPAPAVELARRRAAGLTPRQDANLLRWGYPYVFEDFRFHVTLSERLDAVEAAQLQPALAALFAPAIGQPVDVSDITLFAQSGPDLPFHERARFALTAQP